MTPALDQKPKYQKIQNIALELYEKKERITGN